MLSRDGKTAKVLFLAKRPVGRPRGLPRQARRRAGRNDGQPEGLEGRPRKRPPPLQARRQRRHRQRLRQKAANRETLSAPARLALLHESPKQFPAWNMDWDDRQKLAATRGYIDGKPTVTVVEDGPAPRRAASRTQSHNGSKFTSRRSASPPATPATAWKSPRRSTGRRRKSSLKASVPDGLRQPDGPSTTATSACWSAATTTRRNTRCRSTSGSTSKTPAGDFGVAVLNDSKYGGGQAERRRAAADAALHARRLGRVRRPEHAGRRPPPHPLRRCPARGRLARRRRAAEGLPGSTSRCAPTPPPSTTGRWASRSRLWASATPRSR